MNSFGRIFRVHIFGESHGESVGVCIDGIPAGLSLTKEDFLEDIERRKGGTQKGTTPRQESDLPIFKSGIFNNKTTGAPLIILFENKNTRSTDYEKQRDIPRPGHADFVASKKFGGFEDYRGGGHFSGRLTVCLVAAGVVAKKLLALIPVPSPPLVEKGAPVQEHSNNETEGVKNSDFISENLPDTLAQTQHKEVGSSQTSLPIYGELVPTFREGQGVRAEGLKVRSNILEIGGETDLDKGLQNAINAKDSIGGIVECRVTSLPIGLGEPFFDSIESLLAHAVFAIPAVKGIEFGAGFAAAKMFGSQHNDAIEDATGKTKTNHAGGIVGGITNGNELVFRIAIKPTSSTPKEQQTLNRETNQIESFSVKGRHDLCIALRVPVVLEAVTAMVLADLMLLEQRIPRILS